MATELVQLAVGRYARRATSTATPTARSAPRSAATVNQLFSRQVYLGGALALYALRQRVGDATFRQIERAWVSRYRDGVASTADFIALASRVSGQDLGRFLNRWIYGTTTPPLPGHPDWTVDPVETAAARTLAAPAELPFRAR